MTGRWLDEGMVWLKLEVEEFEQKKSKFAKERKRRALNTVVSPKVAPTVPLWGKPI